MKKLTIESGVVFGPFDVIETLEDRYVCDGAHFQFNVVGKSTIENWKGPLPLSWADIDEVRKERNKLLSESDWTQVIDSPVDQIAWAIYRQALRDLPEQEDFPRTIVWPKKPQ
jgi:uncharacterized protein (DUF1015 family)